MRRQIVNEKDIGRVFKIDILFAVPIFFLIMSIGYGIYSKDLMSMFTGLYDIISSPTILITDFLKVGGVSSSLLNVALVGFLNVYIMNKYKLRINGMLIAGFFTVIGFSFFGKNIYNILPIYLGGYLYTRYQKIHFKDIIIVLMFATALAPLISEISFSGILGPVADIFLAILGGVFIGFVIVPLSSHMIKFHDGYNLYNIGFTAGIIGTVLTSILRTFGVVVEPVYVVSESNHMIIIMMVFIILVALMALGLYINKRALLDYRKILKYKGRLITDFTHLVGYGVTFVNMSILGLISITYVLLVGGVVNGPVLAGIFTVVGFGAFGKHVRNVFPITLGVITVALLFGFKLSSTGVIISILFSTTLAPIAGTYGPVVGFFAGMLHMFLVQNVGIIHGGINLYNNGFAGGLVAGVLIPIIDAFEKE